MPVFLVVGGYLQSELLERTALVAGALTAIATGRAVSALVRAIGVVSGLVL